MGEVECSIRLHGMLAGLGVCYLLAGGCWWHGTKSCLGPAEIKIMCLEDATIACSIYSYKSYMHGHVYFCAWLEISPSAVTAVHNSTNPICTVIFTSVPWLAILPSVVTVLHNSTNLMCPVISTLVNLHIEWVSYNTCIRTCNKTHTNMDLTFTVHT